MASKSNPTKQWQAMINKVAKQEVKHATECYTVIGYKANGQPIFRYYA